MSIPAKAGIQSIPFNTGFLIPYQARDDSQECFCFSNTMGNNFFIAIFGFDYMTDYLNSSFDLDDPDLVSALDEVHLWSAPFGMKLLDTIKLKKNIHVLDIGFGTGFPILEVALRLGSTSKVYGIDPWKPALDRAIFKMKQYGIDNIEFIEGEAENIPLPDKSIDLIISNNGINNVENINQVFSECKRIARPGAQFVVAVNLENTMIEFYEVFSAVLDELEMYDEVTNLRKHIHLKRKPLNEWISLFESNDFRIKNVIHDKFKFRYVDGTTMLNHYFIRLAFMDSWKEIVPKDKLTKVFGRIENALNSKAVQEGELSLTVPFVVLDAKKNIQD